jgi:hypothetical protein
MFGQPDENTGFRDGTVAATGGLAAGQLTNVKQAVLLRSAHKAAGHLLSGDVMIVRCRPGVIQSRPSRAVLPALRHSRMRRSNSQD